MKTIPSLVWHQQARPWVRRAGFTLLEVIVALSIALLLIGVSTLSISGIQDEHKLRKISSLIENTARGSLMRAVSDSRRVFVELGPNSIVAPTTQATDIPEDYAFEGNLEIRRYGEKAFRRPDHGEVWEFSPTGVCEPLELRVSNAIGTVELAFDPLTGMARKRSIVVNP